MTPSELSDLLWAQVDRVAPHLLPNGKKEGHEWVAGNVNGDKGNSLKVNLSGKKKWADFAEGDGGDMLDLWMACRGINLHQAMQEAKAFLGIKDDDHHFDAKREKKFSRPDRKKIARYVILFPCLSVVSREHMKGWVPVCQHGEMAFDDIDLLTMLQLVARVVADSLGNFLQGLPTSETPTPPAE